MKGSADALIGDEPARVAADWLLRLDNPALTDEDLQAWLEWLSASDANRNAFDELQSVRRRLRGMPAERRQELIERTVRRPQGLSEAFRERLNLPRPERSAGRPVALALAASLVLAVALGVWMYPAYESTTTYAAPSDRHRTVALSDGSSLVIGAQAVVDVTFSRERRSLTVHQGKAYFEVEPDPTRPFVVAAANVEVAAVGTAFSVERDADKVLVTVTHGRVRVTNTETRATTVQRGRAPVVASVPNGAGAAVDLQLSQGQQTQVELPMARTGVPGSKPEIEGWSDGRVEFVGAPLRDVLAVVNQYAPKQLVIDDPRVGDLTFSGTIFRSHVDEWVDSLPRVYPIEMVALDNATVTLVTRRNSTH
ncbi:FecR family protein [Steroidobacter sp.]|uniref:FecR family protein n=1 Tax=Steroidobacter sp. TaxID=1978227 RepID=UPI001A5D2D9F|nr:FecR domain-containing protein [Steroidobacter sp.]MBL8266819.1 FecR domain-containing protein [Steroidobacter sp.]